MTPGLADFHSVQVGIQGSLQKRLKKVLGADTCVLFTGMGMHIYDKAQRLQET